jgi:hypothetical protein
MRGIVSAVSSYMHSSHRIFDIKVVWGQANAKEGHRCSQMSLVVPTWQRNVDDLRHTHPAVANHQKTFSAKQASFNI